MVTILCLRCLSVFIFCQALDMKAYFRQFLRRLVLFDSPSLDVVKPLGKLNRMILRCHSFPTLTNIIPAPCHILFHPVGLGQVRLHRYSTVDNRRRPTTGHFEAIVQVESTAFVEKVPRLANSMKTSMIRLDLIRDIDGLHD